MKKFNIKEFLTENKLTEQSKRLDEDVQFIIVTDKGFVETDTEFVEKGYDAKAFDSESDANDFIKKNNIKGNPEVVDVSP